MQIITNQYVSFVVFTKTKLTFYVQLLLKKGSVYNVLRLEAVAVKIPKLLVKHKPSQLQKRLSVKPESRYCYKLLLCHVIIMFINIQSIKILAKGLQLPLQL